VVGAVGLTLPYRVRLFKGSVKKLIFKRIYISFIIVILCLVTGCKEESIKEPNGLDLYNKVLIKTTFINVVNYNFSDEFVRLSDKDNFIKILTGVNKMSWVEKPINLNKYPYQFNMHTDGPDIYSLNANDKGEFIIGYNVFEPQLVNKWFKEKKGEYIRRYYQLNFSVNEKEWEELLRPYMEEFKQKEE
jgi:hypothetical protein